MLLLALLPGLPALAESRTAHLVRSSSLMGEPSAGARDLGELKKKTTVEILERQGGWYRVRTSDGQSGWVRMLAVRMETDPNASGTDIGALMLGKASSGGGVATGVRAAGDEKLEKKKEKKKSRKQREAELRARVESERGQLEQFSPSAPEVRQFATDGGLVRDPNTETQSGTVPSAAVPADTAPEGSQDETE